MIVREHMKIYEKGVLKNTILGKFDRFARQSYHTSTKTSKTIDLILNLKKYYKRFQIEEVMGN